MITLQESIMKSRISESVLNKSNAKETTLKDYDYYEKSGKFNKDQLKVIKRAFDEKELSLEKIAVFAKPELDKEWMRVICNILTNAKLDGISEKDTEILLNPKFSLDQLSAVNDAYGYYNLDFEHTKYIANPKTPSNVMDAIAKTFYRKTIPLETAKLIDLTRFKEEEHIKIIDWGVKIGLNPQLIKKFAKPSYSIDKSLDLLREIAREHNMEDRLPKSNFRLLSD